MDGLAEVAVLLRRISAQLEALPIIAAQLEALPKAIAAAQHRGSALTKADRHALERLLPSINGAIGSAVFTARSLVEEAEADRALSVTLDLVLGATPNLRKLGKLLTRANGLAIENLAVRCEARHRDGLLWRVTRV